MNGSSFYSRAIPGFFIVIAAALVLGGQYINRSLWEPDEARYTYVAKEMSEAGSWFVPLRNGEPYAHKPPLMFWLINAGTWFTNGEFNGVSGRLPSFLGTVLSLLALWWLACLWYNRQIALYSVLILSTSLLFWLEAGYGQIDMLFLVMELQAIYIIFKNDNNPYIVGFALAFSLMGLGVLAKGPVGLIVPIGIYASVTLISGNKKNLFKRYWLWGIPLALAWPAAWLFMAWLSGAPSEYFNELLFAQNVGRLSGEFGGHNRPFYYYLKYLVIDFMPWTLLVPGALIAYKKNDANGFSGRRIIGWVVFVVLFFSLSHSKRNLYILSVYPALSMFLASTLAYWEDLSSRWRVAVVYPLVICLVILALAGVALMFPFTAMPVTIPWPILACFSAILGVSAAVLFFNQGSGGITRPWIHLLIAVLIVLEFYVGTFALPAFNGVKSPTDLAQVVETILPKDRKLILYRLHGEIIALYSRRSGDRIDDFSELTQSMKKTEFGIVACSKQEWESLQQDLLKVNCHVSPHFFTMGSKNLMWFEYRCNGL